MVFKFFGTGNERNIDIEQVQLSFDGYWYALKHCPDMPCIAVENSCGCFLAVNTCSSKIFPGHFPNVDKLDDAKYNSSRKRVFVVKKKRLL